MAIGARPDDRAGVRAFLTRCSAIDSVELGRARFDPKALQVVSLAAALAYRVVPLYIENGELLIAMDFDNHRALNDLHMLTGYRIRGLLAPKASIDRVLEDWRRRESGG